MNFDKPSKREQGGYNPDNSSEVETNNAKYDVVYDVHTLELKKGSFRGSDGIILEAIGGVDSPEVYVGESRLENVVREAMEDERPVYFVDLSVTSHDEFELRDEILYTHIQLPIIEALIGLHFVVSAATDFLNKNPKVSRRGFLKSIGKASAGAYFGLPIAREITGYVSTDISSKLPDENSLSRRAQKALSNISDLVHPEGRTTVLHTRNDLIAQKSETIARVLGRDLGRRPELGILVGANHIGIERSLRDDEEERVERLIDDLGKELIYERYITRLDFEKTEDGRIRFVATLLEDPAIRAGLERRALEDSDLAKEFNRHKDLVGQWEDE